MENIKCESAEYIRKLIPEAIWNKPELGKHYIDWHTEDGQCGLTLISETKNLM